MRITCPNCGIRDHAEFVYGGDAARAWPGLECTDAARWYEYVFLRDNPRGRQAEYWQQVYGCRQWLRVERDTVTHEIFTVGHASAVRSCRGHGDE